jgi:PKD repeat protein
LSNPVATTTPPGSVCAGSCVGLLVTATGGAGGYTYYWTAGTTLSSTVIPNPVSCPVFFSTTYTVTVTDANGCIGVDTTTVFVSGPMNATTSSVNASSCGACDGSVSTVVTGGSPPYSYLWSPTGSTTPTYGSLCAGTYTINITDATGCTLTDSTTIFEANALEANYSIVPDSTDAYNFFFFNSSTGAGLTYIWDFADGTTSTLSSPTHNYVLTGTYTICLYIFSATCGDDTLCQTLVVDGILNSCNALFNIADDTLNPDPNAHYIYNLSYGATLSYLWDFGDGSTSTAATPSHVYASTGPYLLCLTIDDGSGCTDTYCDSLISADSINHSSGQMQLTVYDVPPFQGITTGLEEQTLSLVSVFPNPFEETTTFVLDRKNDEVYTFELMDVMGKKLMQIDQISEKQFSISKGALSPGIYFYKICSAETAIATGKLIIRE